MIRPTTSHRIAFPLLVLMTLATTNGQAAALDGDAVRIFGTLDTGFGGAMTTPDTSGDLTFSPTLGGTAGLDIGIGDYFALGAMASVLSLKLEDDIIADIQHKIEMDIMDNAAMGMAPVGDPNVAVEAAAMDAVKEGRSTLLDFALYPRLRIPSSVAS